MSGCGGECVGVVQGARRSGREGPASASQRARLADEHHGQGYSFRKKGNFAAAIEEYSQAIALEPQHFKALFNRGFSWDKVSACAKLVLQLTLLTAFHCHLHCLPQLRCHALPHDSVAAVACGQHMHP